VITGPTASGKTALGVALARELNGEVVSADSMQIYKHLDIGTAKPTAAEMGGIPHHMIDVVSPFDDYSVSRYVDDATVCADDIISRGKLPIIVGGTGLYIESLIAGRIFAPTENESVRAELNDKYDRIGGGQMLAELAKFDPVSAEKLHMNDKKRVVRAFEVYELTGKTQSEHDAETKAIPPHYDALRIALDYADRTRLYARIGERVDEMVDTGFLGEAKDLLKMGVTRNHTSMQAIGYREMMDAALGEMWFSDAVDSVKQRSRQYAKRQLTWLRRREDIRWISWDEKPSTALGLALSTEFLREAGYI
jgi:tRNA dimethylallyltransferase